MCGGPEQFRSLVCTLRFLPARQVFFQLAAGRGSTAPAVRSGLGVGNSGGQADDELGARARAIAAGRDAAPVQLDEGLHQGEAESEPARPSSRGRGPARTGRTPAAAARGRSPCRCPAPAGRLARVAAADEPSLAPPSAKRPTLSRMFL